MVNWSELAVFVTSVSGSLAAVIYATHTSKCTKITAPCVSCDRPVTAFTDLESQLTDATTATRFDTSNDLRI